MPIQVYQAQGGLNRPASNVSNVRVDNSGAIALAKANAGLGNAVLEGANKLHQAMVTSDIMEANNKYNLEMNKLQGKLFENKEANARNNMTQYEEGRQKILDDIFKNGPSSMRDPIVRQAFMQTANKDWVTQSMRMQNYMMGEEQKHQDTVLLNGYQDCLQNITTAYNNSQLLESYVDKGIGFTRAKFANYGEDKIKLEENKWKAQAYGNAINAALAKDDWDAAGDLLQGNGKWLDPKTRASLDKMISERKRNNNMYVSVEGLHARHGKDVEGAWQEHSAKLRAGDNGAGVVAAANKMIGQQLGANKCAIFVGDMIEAAGGDTSLNSTLADGTYVNYENKGLTFNDRNQLRDGDLVFWSVDGSGYTASEDKAAINSNTEAYKGITHVGIYDAKSGKVIQSGTHGVSAMDIDTPGHHFVGAAHQQAKAMDATRLEEERKKFFTAYAGLVNRDTQQQNLIVENTADQLLAMSRDGKTHTAKEYEDAIYSVTGNNSTMYKALLPLAAHFAKGGGYHELTLEERVQLEEAIESGNLSQEQLTKHLLDMNIKPSVAIDYWKSNKKARDAENKADWKLAVNGFYEKIGGKDKTNDLETGLAKDMAKRHVNYLLKNNKPMPSNDEIATYMKDVWTNDSDTVRMYGGLEGFRMIDLFNKGYYRVRATKDPNVLAVYKHGSDKMEFVYKDKFEQFMKR